MSTYLGRTRADPGPLLLPRVRRRGSPVGLAALLVVGGTLLQLLRQPGVPAWDTVLAEDGGIFLTDALNRPGWGNLFRPYEGYLHLVPRLLAALAAALPLRVAAVVLTGGAALVVSLLCLWIYVRSATVFQTRWARILLVLLVLLLPAAGVEAQASINNLHWYLDAACFWVFVRPLGRPRVAVLGALIAGAAALSDPLAGLFLPLAAYRGLQALGVRPGGKDAGSGCPSPSALLAPVAFAVALAVQLRLGVAGRPPEHFLPAHPADLPGVYGLRVAGSLLVGDRFLLPLFRIFGLAFAFGCLAVATLAVVLALLYTRGVARRVVGLASAYSALWLAVPLLVRGTTIYLDRAHPTLLGSRYMINPVLLLAVALLAWADQRAARPDGAQRLRVATTCWFVAVLAASFAIPSVRQNGPSWQRTYSSAQQRCATGGGDTGASSNNLWATVAGPGQVVLPVAPASGPRPAWSVVVDCKRLR